MFPDGLPFRFDEPRTHHRDEPDKPADTGRGVKISDGIYASKPREPNLTGKDVLTFSEGTNGMSTYWEAKCPCCDGRVTVGHFYTHRRPSNRGASCMTGAKVTFMHNGGAEDCPFKPRLPWKVELAKEVEYVYSAGDRPPWFYFRGLEPVLKETLLANLKDDGDE